MGLEISIILYCIYFSFTHHIYNSEYWPTKQAQLLTIYIIAHIVNGQWLSSKTRIATLYVRLTAT